MKNLHSRLIEILMIAAILISCDEDDPQIKITSISFDTASVQVVEGTTVDLNDHLTIEGEDADQAQISFVSDNEEIVTVSGSISVSSSGNVSGISDGSDRVIVTTNDGTNLTDYVDVDFDDY